MYRVDQVENEDGTYNGTLSYSAPVAASAYDASMHTTVQDVFTTEHKNRTTSITAPASAQGVIYRVSQSLDESGQYQGKLDEIRSKYVMFTTTVGAGSGNNAAAIIYRNCPTLIACPDMSGVTSLYSYRIDGLTVNDDGTYDGRLVYFDRRAGGSGWAEDDFHWTAWDGPANEEVNHDIKQTTSKTEVNSFLSGINLRGTSVSFAGRGRWHVHRVTKYTAPAP